LGNLPPCRDVAEALEPMQDGIEHPVRPLQMPAGELAHALQDGVAIAVPLRQDGQHERGGGGGYQVLVDRHGRHLSRRPAVHSIPGNLIHSRATYVKVRCLIDTRASARVCLGEDLYMVAPRSSFSSPSRIGHPLPLVVLAALALVATAGARADAGPAR